MRRKYLFHLTFRIAAALAALLLRLLRPEVFAVLDGAAFFRGFSVLHLFWLVWAGDMVLQLLPLRRHMALGSQKQFSRCRIPTGRAPDRAALRTFVRQSDQTAGAVFLLWLLLTLAVGLLYRTRVLGKAELFLLCVCFYVCDLICVLFFCPFRIFFLKNRCCATCRIFNWDHLMMFSPFVFAAGFFTLSLFFLALLVFVVWEAAFHLHPERFWEQTNAALGCAACTDRLCGRAL